MGTISQKALYLNETKRRIKDRINLIGGDLDDTNTFREYAEELDSIYDDMPKVEGEGSNFTINQTRKGGLEVTPKGKCEQEVIAAVAGTTVEGSNLTVNDFDTTKEMSITPLVNAEQDSYSGKNLFNGIWELGYIDGNTGQNGSNNNLIRTKDYIEVTELTNYKFSIGNPDITIMLVYEYKDDFTYNLSMNKAINIANEYLTTKADTKYIRFRPNAQTTDTSLKCQLEKGTVATSYEPYVGGIPAPNPSYPQDVKVVTGDNSVVVCNINKLPFSDETSKSGGGITVTQENGIFSVSGTATGSGGKYFLLNEEYIIQNGDYLHCLNNTSSSYIQFAIREELNTGIAAITLNSTNKIVDLSDFVGKKIKYVGLYHNSLYNGNLECKPMILNSNQTTDFVIHQEQSKPLHLASKNLFDGVYELGTINYNGQPTSSTVIIRTKNYQKVLGSTHYTITVPNEVTGIEVFYYNDNTFISNNEPRLNQDKIGTFETPANCNQIKWRFNTGYTTLENQTMLEKGETASSYVPYWKLELAGIGDYKDQIVGKTDDWKIVRNVGKVTFVGIENWQRSTNYTNTTMYYLEHGLSNIVADPFLSNYFTFMLGNDDIPHIRWGGTGNSRFLIFSPILNNVDSFKSWLSTHNTTVYYILATPTEETITDTTLVSQLNALADAYGYSGTTNIMTLSATNNAEMSVEVHYNFVTPAPSPDRPSEVKTVSGENSIVVQNKNWIPTEYNNFNFTRAQWLYLDNIIPAGTYTMSCGNVTTSSTNSSTTVVFYYGESVGARYSFNFSSIQPINVTLTQDVTKILFYAYSDYPTSAGITVTYTNLMLEQGSTTSTYVAHAEQTYPLSLGTKELCKIGTYEDKIVGSKDNWKIVRKVGKVIFDETTFLSISNETENNKSYYFISNTILPGGSVISNYFSEMNEADVILANVVGIHTHSTVNRIYISMPRTIGETLTTLRQWLANHNTINYYQLTTPTEETITDTTLISQLNAIYNAQGYDGQTNIMTISPSTNADLVVNVKALKEFPSE